MAFPDIIYCLVLTGLIALILLSLVFEKKAGISPTPVLPWVRRQALAVLEQYQPLGETVAVADLGSGWGGMVGELHKKYPKAHITGYEMSPCPYWFSRLRFAFAGDKIALKCRNFFTEDISGYDVVFCYLSPQHMEKLKPQLAALKKGSLVVTCSFPITGWEPLATKTVRSLVHIPVCIYRV